MYVSIILARIVYAGQNSSSGNGIDMKIWYENLVNMTTWSAVNKKTQWAKIYIKKLFSYSQLQGDRYSQSYWVCTHDYRYYLVNKVVYSYFCNSDRIDLFVDDCTMT